MLATRVIPVVLYNGTQAVKSVRFDSLRNVGSLIQVARVYEQRQVDELVFLDIAARGRGVGPDFKSVGSFAIELSCPFTVGGGIRDLNDIENLFALGADKVALVCGLRDQWLDLVRASASRFGSQAIVATLDVKLGVTRRIGENFLETLKKLEDSGAGEILLNDMARDGTRSGFNLSLIAKASRYVKPPLIINGGCSDPADCAPAIRAGAHAVAASSIFHFTASTPEDCKVAMREAGIMVRL